MAEDYVLDLYSTMNTFHHRLLQCCIHYRKPTYLFYKVHGKGHPCAFLASALISAHMNFDLSSKVMNDHLLLLDVGRYARLD
jgi:hypothetical protein